MRYFVDVNGVIFTVFADGSSNFPRQYGIVGDTVLELCSYHGEALINDEYQLWNSLTELAKAIEG